MLCILKKKNGICRIEDYINIHRKVKEGKVVNLDIIKYKNNLKINETDMKILINKLDEIKL